MFFGFIKIGIESVISKGKTYKLCKLKEKNTNSSYQGQVSMIKINKISNDDVQQISTNIGKIKKLKHPSLLKFIGYSPNDFKKQLKPVIVTEFPLNGSLSNLLELSRINDVIENWNETKKLMIIFGIATAFSYLHSNGISMIFFYQKSVILDYQHFLII